MGGVRPRVNPIIRPGGQAITMSDETVMPQGTALTGHDHAFFMFLADVAIVSRMFQNISVFCELGTSPNALSLG